MKNTMISIHSRSNRYLCKWSHLNVPRGTLSEQLGWQRGLNLVPNLGTRFFLFSRTTNQNQLIGGNTHVRFKTST